MTSYQHILTARTNVDGAENCLPPDNASGYDVVDNIRRMGLEFGHITLFKAYLETTAPSLASQGSLKIRSELQSSGVSLTDCPRNEMKDTAKVMMLGVPSVYNDKYPQKLNSDL